VSGGFGIEKPEEKGNCRLLFQNVELTRLNDGKYKNFIGFDRVS